jgi:Protein of unknown function (DUF1552)
MKLSIRHRRQRLQRRDFVKWMGGAALALPALELFERPARAQAQATSGAKTAKFAVFIYTNDGMHPPAFFPPNGSTDPTASATLSPLAPHKDQVILLGAPVDGIGFPVGSTGLAYNMRPPQHQANICFTASKKTFAIAAGQANADGTPNIVNKGDGPSMDYVIAQSSRRKPLLLAMHPVGGDTPSDVTFDESGNPQTRLFQAGTILSTVFGTGLGMGTGSGGGQMTASGSAVALAKQGAITTFLNGAFGALRPQLSGYDRVVLDQHLAQLRAYETSLTTRLMTPVAPTGAACAAPSATAVPAQAQDGSETQALSNFIMQTISIAFSCGMNNVATVSFGYPGGGGVGGLRMPWLSYNKASFDDPLHFVSHNNGNAALVAKYALMNQWIVSQMALLMDLLKAIPTAGGGTLLDETVIYLTNRHGDGNGHTNYALPAIIGGGAGGYFETGQNVVLAKATSPTDVLVSIGRSMGVPISTFPLPTFNGVACPSANGPYSSTTELEQIKA